MTEKDLFRTTLITLGSTIVLPLIVGVSGLAAPGDKPTNDLIKSYVGTSAVKTEESKDTAKTDEAKPTDQNKSTDQAQSSDTPKTDAAVPAAGAAPASAIAVTAAASVPSSLTSRYVSCLTELT